MKTIAIVNSINERITYLKNLEAGIKEKLSYLPKEKLYTMKSGKRIMYYTISDKDSADQDSSCKASHGNKKIYISKNQKEYLIKLQKKNYYSQVLKTADKEIRSLEKALKQLIQDNDTDSVYLKLKTEQKTLIAPYVEGLNKKDLEKWQNDFMTHRNIADKSCLITKGGTRVRSKSELIIAERFETYGLPYKYECAIFVGDKDVWFPDFTVLNKRTGKQFIWEHFGMMDNPDYCASAQYKIEKYAKEGFIQGKNLIITTESSLHSLNTKYVDAIIEKILL